MEAGYGITEWGFCIGSSHLGTEIFVDAAGLLARLPDSTSGYVASKRVSLSRMHGRVARRGRSAPTLRACLGEAWIFATSGAMVAGLFRAGGELMLSAIFDVIGVRRLEARAAVDNGRQRRVTHDGRRRRMSARSSLTTKIETTCGGRSMMSGGRRTPYASRRRFVSEAVAARDGVYRRQLTAAVENAHD